MSATLTGMHRSLQEHARMVEQEHENLRRAYLTSIQALMQALEARDPLTRGHAERVRAWSIRIAQQLNLPAAQIEELAQAARLHDIGKVGIRDSILEKPGPLSAEEWQIMRCHPLVGVTILQPIRFLKPALPIIRGHHERWDGKGYPDGLQGEEIPIGARIVAVADAYDALVTDRVYRRGFERSIARQILHCGSGKQWDERVVAALLTVQRRSAQARYETPEPVRQAIDPVCGMKVVPEQTQARAEHQAKVYFFCSTACREVFDQNPNRYVYMR